ncbi:Synapse-associated protein 1 [Podila epigama]|nr:Synapse-associated protein 1 [Podila epigama]
MDMTSQPVESATNEQETRVLDKATTEQGAENAQKEKEEQEHEKKEAATTENTSSTSPPTSAGAFAAAVFPGGFAPPKLNTSAFFSSVQGKLQTTLAQAKSSPAVATLNTLQPPTKINIHQIQASTGQIASTTKGWGVSAFKSISSAAQRVGANVTQGLQKEHEEFLKQKKMETVTPHQGTEALPAWAGMPDENVIKARILSLSKDKRNFLLPPPPGTDFVFDMKVYSSTAMATLKQDPNLDKMRFYLVPKEVEELVFWRNYFYRVSLLKQVSLAAAASDASVDGNGSGSPGSGSVTDSTAFPEGAQPDADGNNPSQASHRRTLSLTSALGYNIYFGKDDVDGPPASSSSSTHTTPSRKNSSTASTGNDLGGSSKDTKPAKTAKPAEKKPEVIFEAEMPDQDEDPDAWLEKQLASNVTIGDGHAEDSDVDVADWEKELQNELKDYVEGA